MFWSVNEITLTMGDQNIPKIERDKRAHFANCAWSQWIGHRQVGSQDKSLCLPQLTTNYYQLLFPCWPLGNSDHQTGRQKRPCCTAHDQNDDMGYIKRPSNEQLSFILSSREGVLDITVRLLNVSLGDCVAPVSDICSYLPRYLRKACASREGCDGRWGAGLGRGGRRGGQRQGHLSHDRHHNHRQQCHLDNHYHYQVDFSVREHTERSKAVWSTASFQLKLVRTIFFL